MASPLVSLSCTFRFYGNIDIPDHSITENTAQFANAFYLHNMSKPLVENKYQLKKFSGKGGWTYAEIPEIPMNKTNPFGWVKVKGSIDDHSFNRYHLMPMGNGRLFFPVKAEVRKKIKKQAGDTVTIALYPDDTILEIPAELQECLSIEPDANDSFHKLKEGEQQEFIQWIYNAKRPETKDQRLAKTIQLLLQGKTYRTKYIR